MRDTRYEIRSDLIDTLTTDVPIIKAAVEGTTATYYKAFYVNANAGSDTNSGLTPLLPVKTLAAAIVLSNAVIALDKWGWAARNVIYYEGDNKEVAAETLITLPNKCDVVGVGSYDHRPMPMLIGNHVIGAGTYMGTRFINMGFMSPAAGGVVFTAPTTTSGLAFLNCHIDGRSTTPATIGILGTAIEQFTVEGCKFFGKFSTATIDIGAGSSRMLLIKSNQIESGAIGVRIDASMTCADSIAMIIDNYFAVETLTVDDNSSKCMICNNTGYTAAAKEIANVLDCDAKLCTNNYFGNDTANGIYPALAAIA